MSNSYVMKALRIFSFEEMLNLSQSALVRPIQLKKAAGEDLVFWSDASDEEVSEKEKEAEMPDNVLSFKKDFRPIEEEITSDQKQPQKKSDEQVSHIISTDFVLLNREMAKESASSVKKEAARGYARATEMYVVKSANIEGSESIRFASTNGVLVDKKQA